MDAIQKGSKVETGVNTRIQRVTYIYLLHQEFFQVLAINTLPRNYRRRTFTFCGGFTYVQSPVIASNAASCSWFSPFFIDNPSSISTSTIEPWRAQITRFVFPAAKTSTAA